MSSQIVPSSTLTSVLGPDDDGSLIIAPELMGVNGEAPKLENQANNGSTSGIQPITQNHDIATQGMDSWNDNSNFPSSHIQDSSSNPNDPLQSWDMYTSQEGDVKSDTNPFSLQLDHAQSSGSHLDAPQTQAPDGADIPADGSGSAEASNEGPRPKKRSRTTTKRISLPQPIITDPSGLDDTQLGNAEYEDPSRDWRMGPVFVQPPPGAAQACMRCHRIKRKCDGGRPRCAGCAKTNVACVYELNPATSSWVQTLKDSNISLSAQLVSAHERLAQLEAIIGHDNLVQKGIDADETAAALFAAAAGRDQSYRGDSGPTGSTATSASATGLGAGAGPKPHTDFANIAKSVLLLDHTPNAILPLPPSDTLAVSLDIFYQSYGKAYPVIARAQMVEMGNLAHGNGRYQCITLLSVALGGIAWAHSDFLITSIGDRAMNHFAAAMAAEDILAVKTLVLLAVYALSSNSPLPVGHIVSIALSMAISLNLHRKADEEQSRVWWSVYALERCYAASTGRPNAIRDEDIALPNPVSRAGDSPSLPTIVTLSQIYGRIQSGGSQSIPEREAELAEWLKPYQSNEWAQVRYHQSLCLLYRPSTLRPDISSDNLKKLYAASTAAMRICDSNINSRPFDGFEQAGKFLACTSVLFSLCEYDNNQSYAAIGFNAQTWPSEIMSKIETGRKILASGAQQGTGAQNGQTSGKYSEVFERLSAVLLARVEGDLAVSNLTRMGNGNGNVNAAASAPGTESNAGENDWNVVRRLWFDPAQPSNSNSTSGAGQGQSMGYSGPSAGMTDQGGREDVQDYGQFAFGVGMMGNQRG